MNSARALYALIVQHRIWTPIAIVVALVLTLLIKPFPTFFAAYPVWAFSLGMVVLFFVYTVPLFAVAGGISNYQLRSRSLLGLLILYLELILLFAVIYYLFVLLDPTFMHLKGVHQIWWLHPDNTDTKVSEYLFSNAGRAFLDCLHFSVVTTATVGYGDMVPQSAWLRLIVDGHIILSTTLVVVGFGKYFNNGVQ